ncbi:MAG TPA: biotin/lipoyl-containing protein [Verrucomicrobiae bacterium]|jgi:biotin carboxyl carrier protein|nr:biotin/lipoyl-containing protein [Verrucomicrobiae bacterium]
MKSHWRDGDRVREVELQPLAHGRWRVRVDESEFELSSEAMPDGRLRLVGDGRVTVAEVTPEGARRFVRLGVLDFVLERAGSGKVRAGAGGHDGGLSAPMPGVITKVMVVVGDEVTRGQPLLALEAMKMEHLIRAPREGRVKRVGASPGQMVQAGAELVELEA